MFLQLKSAVRRGYIVAGSIFLVLAVAGFVYAMVGVGQYRTIIGLAVGSVFMIISIVEFFKAITNSCLKEIYRYAKENPTESLAKMNYELEDSISYGGHIWIGEDYTFVLDKHKAYVINHKRLVWAYYYAKGGQKSKSSLVGYYLDKKRVEVNLTKKEAMKILRYYTEKLPKLVTGFDSRLEKEFKEDYNLFLNRKYHVNVDTEAQNRPNPFAKVGGRNAYLGRI